MNKELRTALLIVLSVLMLCLMTACGSDKNEAGHASGAASSASERTPEYQDFTELSGKRISMLTGAPFENLVLSKAPDAGEFSFFNSTPDMILALKEKKIDAFLTNNAVGDLSVNRDPALAMFPQSLEDSVFGFAFAKGDKRRDEWQKAYDSISEEKKQELWNKWTGPDEAAKQLPEQDWPGKNGTVKAAVCDSLEPMSYIGVSGTPAGFDIEMILLMAEELDIRVDFSAMEFSAIMASVQSGKADIGAGSIVVTDERRESVDFIEYYPAAFVLVVRNTGSSGGGNDSAAGKTEEYTSLDDFRDKRIGVMSGAIQGGLVEKQLPDAETFYYSSKPDILTALRQGKIDAYCEADMLVRYLMLDNEDLTYLDEPLNKPVETGAIFPKTDEGDKLRDEFNVYLEEIRSDGTLEKLDGIWLGKDEELKKVRDAEELPAKNGTLRLAVDSATPPVAYISDGKIVGYDYDIAVRFCESRGYGLEVTDMSFSGLVDAVASGKIDFAIGCIAITEERKQSVNFSDTIYSGASVMAYLKPDAGEEPTSFFGSLRESFQKTFIREDRWKLFVSGIGTTLLINVMSILLGTLLGFCVFMLCRNGNRAANLITRFCVWLIQGMPVVVLLMILYYIIFSNSSLSGTAISIVGFTLIFASSVYGMLKAGTGAVGIGQTEAAYALGYTNRGAFFRVVLPQALPHFMPAYKGQITALIKATAIVGYIAVQDLTKMGDIVRSRTYEAFFPLIAVAIIYFILAAILTFIVNRIELRVDPRHRTPEDILKGVEK